MLNHNNVCTKYLYFQCYFIFVVPILFQCNTFFWNVSVIMATKTLSYLLASFSQHICGNYQL